MCTRPVGNGLSIRLGHYLLIDVGSDLRIFEETSGTAAVRVAIDDQHRFAAADLTYRVAHLLQIGVENISLSEIFLQVGILQVRLSFSSKPEADAKDDEPSWLIGVETALAIT